MLTNIWWISDVMLTNIRQVRTQTSIQILKVWCSQIFLVSGTFFLYGNWQIHFWLVNCHLDVLGNVVLWVYNDYCIVTGQLFHLFSVFHLVRKTFFSSIHGAPGSDNSGVTVLKCAVPEHNQKLGFAVNKLYIKRIKMQYSLMKLLSMILT